MKLNTCTRIKINFNRKLASVNEKGVLAAVVDHISSMVHIEPKLRSLSREFLAHGDGCAPCNKVYTTIESKDCLRTQYLQ